jgi:hypothetical protein
LYRCLKTNIEVGSEKYYLNIGEKYYSQYSTRIWRVLKDFIHKDGAIDGSLLQSHWFPEINADIFLSHSHKDRDRAVSIAGWLFEEFGLKTFIDSCIWDYSDKLLKDIDEEYCRMDNNSYSYEKRNYSTSHVHMMLNTALSKMIDKCECMIFLNTPNSISARNIIEKTESPWIYSELFLSKIIQKREPERLMKKSIKENQTVIKSRDFNEQLNIQYSAELDHLTELTPNIANEWASQFSIMKYKGHALDLLYELTI